MSEDRDCVVVTGFGPFGSHKINASWECVQELARIGLGVDQVELAIYEVPVVYAEVKRMIPHLWEKHKPALMVHVGVSGEAHRLTLEQQAHNDGYRGEDVHGKVPTTSRCVVDSSCDLLVSGIDMAQVIEEVNTASPTVRTVISHDAGRYLCDFTYFQSLHTNKDRAAFIHVPPLGAPYTVIELAEGLQTVICAMLKQVRQ